MLFNHTINDKSGDLTIMVDESWVDDFLDTHTDKCIGWLHSDDSAINALEEMLCNGFSVVPHEDVGALTDSLLISDCACNDDGSWPNDMNIWFIPNYCFSSGSVAYQLVVNKSFTFAKVKGD